MASRPARHRYCRCGTRLAVDNTERQCARCQRASRDKLIVPPNVPTEFWRTEQFRDAFAAQHIGWVARTYRTHPYHHATYGPGGISQTLLGQWLGLRQPQVSRIETGVPIRDLDTLVYWARVLRIPAELLWFDMPGQPRRLVTHDRRASLAHVERLRHHLTDTLSSGSMTGASLDDWEQTVLRHGQLTRDRPPGLLLSDLGADLAELPAALGRCRTSSALRRLTRVTAQLAGLMCLTFIKLDDRRAFLGWARTARLAADEAGDPLTCAWVNAQEAYGHFYGGDLAGAVDVAQHAQMLAGSAPSVGAVLAAALEARAQAGLAREHETREAIVRAETMLSCLDDTSTGTSAFDYNEAQLHFHEGNALTHLHDTAKAWQAQQRALDLCPVSDYMDRTLTWLDRASCLACDGDVDGAVTVTTDALVELTADQRQGIISARAWATLTALPGRQQSPAVRDLHDLLVPPPMTRKT